MPRTTYCEFESLFLRRPNRFPGLVPIDPRQRILGSMAHHPNIGLPSMRRRGVKIPTSATVCNAL